MTTPRLTNSEIVALTALRHALHRRPELSGEEAETARQIATTVASLGPDEVLTGLGGHGVAAVWSGPEAGPTVLLRCELDGLPIEETGTPAYRSETQGKGHLCGHDGHMAMLTGVAHLLSRQRPRKGRVVLMYQPAEEDGAGAAKVVADPAYGAIAPDWAFSIHNFPGLPLGHVSVTDGPVNCASRGMKLAFTGRTAHASQPETGQSPMAAIAHLMPALTALSKGTVADADFTLATVTHTRMGEAAFGIAPGYGEVWVTLRTLVDAAMDDMMSRAETLAHDAAAASGLHLAITYHDIFHHCENDPDATRHIEGAVDTLGLERSTRYMPLRGSEDFGRFGKAGAKSAMLFLGAGEKTPALHNPDYDFPDDLIPTGTAIFAEILRRLEVLA